MLNAPGQTAKLFVISGQRVGDHMPYQQHGEPLVENQICRFAAPDLDAAEERRVEAIVSHLADDERANLRATCPRIEHTVGGPVFVIGGEMSGEPAYLDFSRRGAFVSVSLDGYLSRRLSAENSSAPARGMKFWLLIPPEHTLLIQRTTPAPVAVIPTNRGTLFQFAVPLLPFPKSGDLGGQFLSGALSLVYESDLRASLRDYLVFVLAAVFAFALERLSDALAPHRPPDV